MIDVHDRSEALLQDLCAQARRPIHVVHVDEDGNHSDERIWNESRYHHMVWLRNHLLAKVRELAPQWFLSLDSDILLAPGVLANLMQSAERFDAVGGKCYMTETGRAYPSNGTVINVNGLMREDLDDVRAVDCIMAVKLMNPEAYAVDYEYNWLGEDIAWSQAVTAKGLTIGYDGRICSRHVMSRIDGAGVLWSDTTDPRC